MPDQSAIIDLVLNEGIVNSKRRLTADFDIAFAELVADVYAWDAQAEHRTGTPGDKLTSEMLVERLGGMNLATQIIEFPLSRRVPVDCHVRIGSKRIEGIPLFDGGETREDITGTIAAIGESGDIGLSLATATGGPTTRQLYDCRRDTTYQALIGISRNATRGIAMLNADAFDQPFGLPTLIVDGQDAAALEEAANDGQTVSVRVLFEVEETIATNVQAIVAGRDPKLAPVVVMTPKSSWWTSTAERCGGVAAWLACVRTAATNQPERTIIFTANTGHELGHVGLDRFLEQNPGLGQTAHVWVHLGANFAATNSAVRMQYSHHELGERFRGPLDANDIEIADVIDGSVRPGGEARNIYDAGGRYVSLLGSNSLFHHPDDRMQVNVDFDRAMRARNAVVDLVRDLSAA